MRTHDCLPTLTDSQVLEFCKTGYLMLEGIVPDDVNRRAYEYCDAHPSGQPSEILREDWFVDGVIRHPTVTGVVRSLLGRNFALPILMANHRNVGPQPAQSWHRDGGSLYGPELKYLQVFYYPQACTREMGPTELLPGSHFLYSLSTYMGHYGKIRGGIHAIAPAGSVFLTIYSIWHRRSAGTAPGVRNLLKYCYWRTVPPTRDWLVEPDFDVATADFSMKMPTFRQQFRDFNDCARMFFWLAGEIDRFDLIGGQAWPLTIGNHNLLDRPYGLPNALTGMALR